MIQEGISLYKPDIVSAYVRKGYTEVKLRKDIVEDVADDGPDGEGVTFWKYNEMTFNVLGNMSVDYLEDNFDMLWNEHLNDDRDTRDIASESLELSKKLSTEVSDVVESVEKNLESLNATVTQKLADVDENVDTMNAAVTEAQNAAKAAQTAAENAKTDPAVAAVATMYVNSIELKNSEISDVRDLIKDFVAGEEYKKGWIRRYNGKYYRMALDISSTTSTAYQPGTGTESLYTPLDLAPDGIRIWHTVTCADDSFTLGELCHYPDAEGPIYVSKRVGNTSVPGTDQWWELQE